jgi:hypothetical protein
LRVKGKLIRKSLITNLIPVAKLRLSDLEKQNARLPTAKRRTAKASCYSSEHWNNTASKPRLAIF